MDSQFPIPQKAYDKIRTIGQCPFCRHNLLVDDEDQMYCPECTWHENMHTWKTTGDLDLNRPIYDPDNTPEVPHEQALQMISELGFEVIATRSYEGGQFSAYDARIPGVRKLYKGPIAPTDKAMAALLSVLPMEREAASSGKTEKMVEQAWHAFNNNDYHQLDLLATALAEEMGLTKSEIINGLADLDFTKPLSKVANTTLYHVSPASKREDIQKYGLNWWQGKREYPGVSGNAVYLWDNWDGAQNWINTTVQASVPMDIWTVDATNLNLSQDEQMDSYGGGFQSWTTLDPIPPDRLSLRQQDQISRDSEGWNFDSPYGKVADYFYDWQGYYPDDGSLEDGIISPNSPAPAYVNTPRKCPQCGGDTPPGHMINLDESEKKNPWLCPDCGYEHKPRSPGYAQPMEYDEIIRSETPWHVLNSGWTREDEAMDHFISNDPKVFNSVLELVSWPLSPQTGQLLKGMIDRYYPQVYMDWREWELDPKSVNWDELARIYSQIHDEMKVQQGILRHDLDIESLPTTQHPLGEAFGSKTADDFGKSNYIGLYRGMTDTEYAKWLRGETILSGKYFTATPRYFKVNPQLLKRTKENTYRLIGDAVLVGENTVEPVGGSFGVLGKESNDELPWEDQAPYQEEPFLETKRGPWIFKWHGGRLTDIYHEEYPNFVAESTQVNPYNFERGIPAPFEQEYLERAADEWMEEGYQESTLENLPYNYMDNSELGDDWPDELPWGEEEQDYYRSSGVDDPYAKDTIYFTDPSRPKFLEGLDFLDQQLEEPIRPLPRMRNVLHQENEDFIPFHAS